MTSPADDKAAEEIVRRLTEIIPRDPNEEELARGKGITAAVPVAMAAK